MTREIVITSNMKNEEAQLNGWIDNMRGVTNQIIVVLGTSTDHSQQILEDNDVMVVHSDIITKEGYGNARNHLREMARKFFPESKWNVFFDADERILGRCVHHLRHIGEELSNNFDVVAFPRIDWYDTAMTKSKKDYNVYPDYQARMTRLDSDLRYVRKLHEQLSGHRGIYCNLNNPIINHFHSSTPQDKRDDVGKVCSYLHSIDSEFGDTYPKHHKEASYFEKYLKEGL